MVCKDKGPHTAREIELCLKQAAPALSLYSWVCKNGEFSHFKDTFQYYTPWQFCRLEVPPTAGLSKEDLVEPWRIKFKCKNMLLINGESAHVSRYQSD